MEQQLLGRIQAAVHYLVKDLTLAEIQVLGSVLINRGNLFGVELALGLIVRLDDISIDGGSVITAVIVQPVMVLVLRAFA